MRYGTATAFPQGFRRFFAGVAPGTGAVNKPSVQTMEKIARGLGVSIDDLMK